MIKLFQVIICLLVFTKSFLYGQSIPKDTIKPDSTTLNEVVIRYGAVAEMPFSFRNISPQEIKEKNVGQEPSFLFSETPSITAYSDAGSTQGYSYYRIRGIDQSRINVTLDGVPLNEPEDQGMYFSNYANLLGSISAIQIQRGAGTTKNGIASYGGSIQLATRDLPVDSITMDLGTNYGSYSTFRVFGGLNAGNGKNGLTARFSHVQSDGYKYNSGNSAQSLFLSGCRIWKKSIWRINYIGGLQKNELAWLGVKDSLIQIDPRINANSMEKDQFTQHTAYTSHTYFINSRSSLHSNIYYTYLKGNYDFNLDTYLGLPFSGELYNYAFESNLMGFFSDYKIRLKRFNISSGIHGNLYNRNHTGSSLQLGQLYTNTGYKNEASFYLQPELKLGKLIVLGNVQIRQSNFSYTGDVPFKDIHWTFINLKSGISYKTSTSSIAYFSIASTGREPTRNDIFGGNDNLLADSLGQALIFITTPEYVNDFELGFRLNRAKLSLDLNLYYMGFKNEIVLNGKFGPNGLSLTDNVDKSFRTGVELSLKYSPLKNLQLSNNSSYNFASISEQETRFSPILTPTIIVNQEISYQFKSAIQVALLGRYQSSSFIDFANSASVNDYFLFNSRISYTLKKLQFLLFINNISNVFYYNQGYVDFDGSRKYFVTMPRNYSLSVQFRF